MSFIKNSHLPKLLIIFGFIVMQLSSSGKAFADNFGNMLFLAGGLLLVNFAWLLIILSTKIDRTLLHILALVFFIAPLEFIIQLKQPAMLSTVPLTLRVICYNLILVGAAASQLKYTKNMSRYTAYSYHYLIPAFVIFSVVLYLANFNPSSAIVGRLVTSENSNPVGVGYSFASVAAICLGISIYYPSKSAKIMHFVAAMAAMAPVIFTASRGPILAIVSLFIFLILTKKNESVKNNFYTKRIFSSVFSFAFILSLAYMIRSHFPVFDEQIEYLIRRISSLSSHEDDASSIERIESINIYFHNFDSFWLSGIPGYSGSYPHNLLLDFFIRYGLYGLAIAVFLYFGFIRIIFNHKKLVSGHFEAALFSLFFFTFLNAQVSLTAEHLRGFWIALPYFLLMLSRKKTQG